MIDKASVADSQDSPDLKKDQWSSKQESQRSRVSSNRGSKRSKRPIAASDYDASLNDRASPSVIGEVVSPSKIGEVVEQIFSNANPQPVFENVDDSIKVSHAEKIFQFDDDKESD